MAGSAPESRDRGEGSDASCAVGLPAEGECRRLADSARHQWAECFRRNGRTLSMKLGFILGAIAFISGPFAVGTGVEPEQNWTNIVGMGGRGLGENKAERLARTAQETHFYAIEVNNDFPGRYEGFLD